jgi:hypothetical protein
MSKFQDLIAVADGVVLKQFGVPLRWVKQDASTADIEGIIDLEVEMMGPDGDFGYLAKAVTVRSSVLAGYHKGETVRELTAAGVLTGPQYSLQQTLANDGGFLTVEISS